MLVHIPVALAIMLMGWALGRWLGASNRAAIWLGWFAGAAACIMREITQHEYRWIEAFGHGQRANMPVLQGLAVWQWNSHSLSETGVALAASALVAWVIARRF